MLCQGIIKLMAMLRFTDYRSSSTEYMHASLLLLLYQYLFTGHTALVNVTKELKNKAVINVVVKSNKVIIIVLCIL